MQLSSKLFEQPKRKMLPTIANISVQKRGGWCILSVIIRIICKWQMTKWFVCSHCADDDDDDSNGCSTAVGGNFVRDWETDQRQRRRHSEVGFRHYLCGSRRRIPAGAGSCNIMLPLLFLHPLEWDSICLLIRQHSGSVSLGPLKSSQRLKLHIHDEEEQCIESIGRELNSLLCSTGKGPRVPWNGAVCLSVCLTVEYEIFNFNSFMKAINNSCRMERFRKYYVVRRGPTESSTTAASTHPL